MGVKETICIIGAGIGGLAAGALLVKNGYKVKIFEKENTLGGRALSFDPSKITLKEYKKLLTNFDMKVAFSKPDLKMIFEKNMLEGYKLDLGYHAIDAGATSNIKKILSEINKDAEFFESKLGFIKEGGYDFPLLSRLDKMILLPRTFHVFLASEKMVEEMDNQSLTDTIKIYGKGKMKLVLELFSRVSSTVNNLDLISTGEMIRAQKNILNRGSKMKYQTVGYPKNGLCQISKILADYIKQNDGEIHLNTSVSKIIIDEGKAKGVMANGKKHNSDYVVSNILVQNLFSIADEKEFSNNYANSLKSLTGTGSLCAYYSLSKINPNLIGKAFLFIERNAEVDGNDAVGMIDFLPTHKDSGVSPKDHYLVQSYIICTPKEAKNKKNLENLRRILDKNLKNLIPNYENNLNWSIYPSIWHLDGVAKTIDNEKPKIEAPVENLYLIGDCVKAPGIGFNCAINSARILINILEKSSN